MLPNVTNTIDQAHAIWKRYRTTRSVEDRNALIVHYAALVDKHAAQLARRLPPRVTFDEVRSAAFDGLMHAVENFDPDRSATFETFCQRRIRGAVADWLRSRDSQSRAVRLFEKRRSRISESISAETGRAPAPADIAARMRLPVRRYQELSRLSRVGSEVHLSSIESRVERDSSGAGRQWEVPDHRENDPARDISRQLLTDYVARGLSHDERAIMVLYYYEGLTMSEIGTVMQLCESRVSQIHKDVIHRLRQRMGRGLIEELAV
jgi:RNA polymerase sigma factor for flagellar operon FliA